MAGRLDYDEGTVFAIPLRDGGFARGVVARMDGQGLIFGYFFGPRVNSVSEFQGTAELKPSSAILSGKCGDLGLLNGEWKVIGKLEEWSRDEWPLPTFVCDADDSNSVTITDYDDDTLNAKSVRTVLRSELEWDKLPIDRVMGYGSVEIRLTRQLPAAKSAS